MQLSIEVIQSKVTSHPSSTGGYQKAEVTYKDLGSGKVAAKSVMSFKNPKVFAEMVNAKPGQVFSVESEKEGQYWEWKSVGQGGTPVPTQSLNIPPKKEGVNAAPKSNYETAEERAARQVLIVKQSSLSVAASVLSVGAKSPPNSDEVIALAQKFTDWVFAKPQGVAAIIEMPNDLGDMPQ
jgi:hypothetical protein